ncbi:MAG: dienelactone hydrolase family protein [bacterium]|nr:dienelactone hydrolase family protein [bacterium]
MARLGTELDCVSNGDPGRGYLAVPAGGKGPGVVVIQEWWGLVDHIRDVCDRLARDGMVALAPDLYRGEATTDPDAAGRLMMDLELPRATRDLDGAVQVLLGHDGVIGSKVGVIGFCMGGQLALDAATRNDRIGAVVDCYGIHPNVQLDLSGLKAPVLGIFAEHDEFVPMESARKLEADLAAAGKRADFTIFSGAGHAFMNDSRPDVHDAELTAKAWSQVLAFFRAEI